MFVSGVTDYTREGKQQKTALVAGRATSDGERRTTSGGKTYGTVSVRAYTRQDGTAAFLTVKAWDAHSAALLASLQKGDQLLAAGRLDIREYNGKTYTDLSADFVYAGDQPVSGFRLAGKPVDVIPEDDFAEIGEEDGKLPF